MQSGHRQFPSMIAARRSALLGLWVIGVVSMLGCQSMFGPFAPEGESVPADQYGWQASAQPEPTVVLASADFSPQQLAVHQVQRGETAWSIARRHGISVDALSRANRLDDAHEITAGTELNVPEPLAAGDSSVSSRAASTPDVAAKSFAAAESGDDGFDAAEPPQESAPVPVADVVASQPSLGSHEVRRGETLWRISRKYQVTPVQMAALNGISTDGVLRSGTILRVPISEKVDVAVNEASTACACDSYRTAADGFSQPQVCEERPDVAAAPPDTTVFESSAPSYTAIDGLLSLADDYLESARFEETIDLAELGLNLLGDHWVREDSGPRIAHAEMIRGVALVALQRPHEGHACFRRALRIEPKIELGAGASPKIESVFEAARAEVESAMSSSVPLITQ